MKKHLGICNKREELYRVAEFVEELGEELNMDTALIMSINLALEEAITNIVMYAYPHEDGQNKINLLVEYNDKELIFILSDMGVAFDPTQEPEADTELSMEDRPIGGLGIFLIRKIMGEVSYQRINGENQLTMKKEITNL